MLYTTKVLIVAAHTGKMRLNYCDKKKWPDENTRQSQRTESLVKDKRRVITHGTIFYAPLINSKSATLYTLCTGCSVIRNLCVNGSFTRVAGIWPAESRLSVQRLTSWPSKVFVFCFSSFILLQILHQCIYCTLHILDPKRRNYDKTG